MSWLFRAVGSPAFRLWGDLKFLNCFVEFFFGEIRILFQNKGVSVLMFTGH